MGSTNFPVDWQDLISEYDLPDAGPHFIVEGWYSRGFSLANAVVVKIPKAINGSRYCASKAKGYW